MRQSVGVSMTLLTTERVYYSGTVELTRPSQKSTTSRRFRRFLITKIGFFSCGTWYDALPLFPVQRNDGYARTRTPGHAFRVGVSAHYMSCCAIESIVGDRLSLRVLACAPLRLQVRVREPWDRCKQMEVSPAHALPLSLPPTANGWPLSIGRALTRLLACLGGGRTGGR